MNQHESKALILELRRFRQLAANQTILRIVRDVADAGYPTNTGQNSGSTGTGRPTSQPERMTIQPDHAADRARRLLALTQTLAGDIVISGLAHEPGKLTSKLRYAADQLEMYDPERNALIECVHCRKRRGRDLDECPHCGIPADAWRCGNPHHDGYVTGPARNGMCEPCDRYQRRRGQHRPVELIDRETIARRTSDTELIDCANPQCPDQIPWRQARDGRCSPCAGHWNSLGRERIPASALALDDSVIVDGAA